jgi:hemolysin III
MSIRSAWGLRHPVSAGTHLLGAGASLAATLSALPTVVDRSPWHLASLLIFGLSLTLLYLASGFYHGASLGERAMLRLRLLDHSLIYVFIAGTYTPFCLLPLRATVGLPVAVAVWGAAAAGVAVKIFYLESSRWVRVAPYVVMSAAGAALMPSLFHTLPHEAVVWVLGGGMIYALGALVYALKWPDPWPRTLGFHEIWHVCVLAASACHFYVVLHWVLK